jgi:anti-sigma regulatory factor (Ser/Thr protein kinase)
LLRIESDAIPQQLANVRQRLTAWLRAADIPDALVADIVLVANEACTNCVEHAYRERPAGTMQVQAKMVDTGVWTRISDTGSWKPPASDRANRGRGLVLIRALSDEMELHTSPTGTTVDATFRLPAQPD